MELLPSKPGVAVTSRRWALLGGRAPVAAPPWPGAPAQSERKTSKSTAGFVPGSRRRNWVHRVHKDGKPGLRGWGELLQRAERGQQAASAAGQAAQLLPVPGEDTPPGLSSPSQIVTPGISPLAQQTSVLTRRRHGWLYLLLLVWELDLVWGQHGRTHGVTCRKANINVTWAGTAGVTARQRQSAAVETRMRRAEIRSV